MFEKITNLIKTDPTDSSAFLKKYKAKKKFIGILIAIFRILVLSAIGYVVIYPMISMLSISFKTLADFSDPSVLWIPKHFTLSHYANAKTALNLFTCFKNTMLYEIVAAVIEIVVCSFVAYGLARFEFKGKNLLMFMLILIILVPDQMIIIPKVVNYSNLDFLGIISLINKVFNTNIRINILNSGFSFYLPSLFAVGLRSGIIIFIYTQFYKGLPKELEEAAWIDGAGLFKTYTQIALPSSGVVITTVSIFSVIWHWNDYYLAVMYMNVTDKWPLAVRLSDIGNQLAITLAIWGGDRATGAINAACVFFVLPVLIMYIFMQRRFVKSIDRVGITG